MAEKHHCILREPVGLCARVVSLEVLASVVGVVRERVGCGVDQCGAKVLWLMRGFLFMWGVVVCCGTVLVLVLPEQVCEEIGVVFWAAGRAWAFVWAVLLCASFLRAGAERWVPRYSRPPSGGPPLCGANEVHRGRAGGAEVAKPHAR